MGGQTRRALVKYKTSAAFRQALEARLRDQSLLTGAPLARLRKMVAFDRFLARLSQQHAESWIVKGGYALQLRLGDVARTTRDIDVAPPSGLTDEKLKERLRKAAGANLGDWFEFEVGQPTAVATGAPGKGLRFPVRCLLDGRTFETFHLDVGQGDPLSDKPERLTGSGVLDFANVPRATISCYPLTSQIAEKLHAYTRAYEAGESSRVRDLVDILLIASFSRVKAPALLKALQATFEARDTHSLPSELPRHPAGWSGPYRRLAGELPLHWPTVAEAWQAARDFLNSVLQGTAKGMWNPETWTWE